MASIKDALEEVAQDNLSALKCILLAIPLFYSINIFYDSKSDFSAFYWMGGITFVLLFGFMLKCTSNVKNEEYHVLPSFNIFGLLGSGLKGLIALGPVIAVCSWLGMLGIEQINNYFPEPNTALVFKIIMWLVLGSIILTGYMLYSKNFKISDAYNLKVISQSSMDIMIRIIFMLPGIAIINGLIVGFVTYVLWVFLGIPNPICTFFWCVAGVYNIAIIGHYIAQVDFESIEKND